MFNCNTFWALFTLTVGKSTITLLVCFIAMNFSNCEHNTIWRPMMIQLQGYGKVKCIDRDTKCASKNC